MKENFNEEEYYEEEEYVDDIEFVQAPTLPELRKKLLKKLDDGGSIEQNPFWDPQNNLWTVMVLYYNDEEEENEN